MQSHVGEPNTCPVSGLHMAGMGMRPIERRARTEPTANCQVRLWRRGNCGAARGTDSCHTAVLGVLVRAKGPLRSLSADGKQAQRGGPHTNLLCIREKHCRTEAERREHLGGAARKPICRCPCVQNPEGDTGVHVGAHGRLPGLPCAGPPAHQGSPPTPAPAEDIQCGSLDDPRPRNFCLRGSHPGHIPSRACP